MSKASKKGQKVKTYTISIFVFIVISREIADAQAASTDSMVLTQQDARRTCLKKRDRCNKNDRG